MNIVFRFELIHFFIIFSSFFIACFIVYGIIKPCIRKIKKQKKGKK